MWSSGFFWLACKDGGLVRWDGTKNGFRTFYPALDKRSFSLDSVRLDSAEGFTKFPDSSKQVIGVAPQPDTGVLLVLTPNTMYRFFSADTSWNALSSRPADASKTFISYCGVSGSDHSQVFFATIIAKNGSTCR